MSAGTFGSVDSHAVAILHRPGFECWSVVNEFDSRFVLVKLGFRGVVFRVAMLPIVSMTAMISFVSCLSGIDPAVPTLLCGNFNKVLGRVVDRRGSCPFYVSRESFAKLSMLFWIAVLWIFGVKCTPVFLRLLGVDLMGLLLHALTLSVARMFGCLM